MKKGIHPKMQPVIFRDASAGVDFHALSTLTSETIEKKDGVTYHVVPIEVSSASHPFFTGKEHIIDIAGRVEKFKKRIEKANRGK